ncbi:MAG: hypothetical protein ACK4MH_02755 [Brevundimonas sp.]|uniref:hypothetical protein n=1 Tax=Brevundimonas sp. TaxID=1871086 RepID=UPI00391A0915
MTDWLVETGSESAPPPPLNDDATRGLPGDWAEWTAAVESEKDAEEEGMVSLNSYPYDTGDGWYPGDPGGGGNSGGDTGGQQLTTEELWLQYEVLLGGSTYSSYFEVNYEGQKDYTWTSPGYDSLEHMLNGELYWGEIDPEFLEAAGLTNYDNSWSGFDPASNDFTNGGTVARQTAYMNTASGQQEILTYWAETTFVPNPGGPDNIVITMHARSVLWGIDESKIIDASGSDWFRRGVETLDLAGAVRNTEGLLGLYQKFVDSATDIPPDSQAATVRESNASYWRADVTNADGTALGSVEVTPDGFRIYNQMGQLIQFVPPQYDVQWNSIAGAEERQGHYSREGRYGIAFAQQVAMAPATAASATLAFFSSLGFDIVSSAVSDGYFGKELAKARFYEAAYEVRKMQLAQGWSGS